MSSLSTPDAALWPGVVTKGTCGKGHAAVQGSWADLYRNKQPVQAVAAVQKQGSGGYFSVERV